jgi:hypothetical protein
MCMYVCVYVFMCVYVLICSVKKKERMEMTGEGVKQPSPLFVCHHSICPTLFPLFAITQV